jgi:hypothetical protein
MSRRKIKNIQQEIDAHDRRYSARAGRPTPVSIQREERARIRAEFYAQPEPDANDPHRDAREIAAGDPILTGLLDKYIAASGPAIDLAAVPRHRRAAHVETVVSAFSSTRSAVPCGSCGSYSHRWPQDADPIHLDSHSKPPAHVIRSVKIPTDGKTTSRDLLLCGWCADQVSWRAEGIVGLAMAVFAATAGYRGTIGRVRTWLAFEKPTEITGEPWAHVNSASAVGRAHSALVRCDIMRSRLVTSEEQAAEIAKTLPGIKPHVWTDVPKPGPLPVSTPGTAPKVRKRESQADRDHQNFLERKRARNNHDALNHKQLREVNAFYRSRKYDGKTGLTGRDALELDGLLEAHRKAHADNGCLMQWGCTSARRALAPSRI